MGTKNSCSIVSVAVKLSFLANLFKDLLRTNKNSKLRNIKMFSLKLTVGAAMLVVLASAVKFPQSSANLMRRLEAGPQRRRMVAATFNKDDQAGYRRRMMAATFKKDDQAGYRRRMMAATFNKDDQAGYRRQMMAATFNKDDKAGYRRRMMAATFDK